MRWCALLMTAACATTVDPRALGTGRYSSLAFTPGWEPWPPPFLVAVMTHAQYEVIHYYHLRTDSGIPPDPSSPTGFALLPGGRGTVVERRSETIRGTGIVLSQEGDRCLILTSRHVVQFPETVRTEVSTSATGSGRLLIGQARRKAQVTLVGLPGRGQAQARVVAVSEGDDLAILGTNTLIWGPHLSPLPYRLGHSHQLRPGDGVYILGVPRGSFQVTWGVATPVNEATFLVSTSTPPGYSGAPVLATVRGTGALELVGVVTGTGGERIKVWSYDDTVLPGSSLADVDPRSTTADEFKSFDYGITYCATASRVAQLLARAGLILQGEQEQTLRSLPAPLE